jgi:3-dehydroquinate dehydratase type I
MICVSIGEMDFSRLMKVLSSTSFAEIRLDQNQYTSDEVQQIFSHRSISIATCRPTSRSEAERKKLLLTAIEAGADYIDIGIENGGDFREQVMTVARRHQCRVILSYHNHDMTPPLDFLKEIIASCVGQGADISKIACQALSPADSARLLSLYDLGGIEAEKLIALGMGEMGKITRIAGPLLGAPFTYAAFSDGMQTAEGQLDRINLTQIFNTLGARIK